MPTPEDTRLAQIAGLRAEKAELVEALEAAQSALIPFAFFCQQLQAMFNMLGGPEDMEPDDTEASEVITAANGQGAHVTLRKRHFMRALAVRQDAHAALARARDEATEGED